VVVVHGSSRDAVNVAAVISNGDGETKPLAAFGAAFLLALARLNVLLIAEATAPASGSRLAASAIARNAKIRIHELAAALAERSVEHHFCNFAHAFLAVRVDQVLSPLS
jgi:hypothetical protein